MCQYKYLFIFLVFTCTSIQAHPIIATNAPELEYAETTVDQHTERVLGEMIMQKIQGSDLVLRDYLANEYLKKFSTHFYDPKDPIEIKPHFFCVQSEEFNAFAFFGSHVAVHSGLIQSVANESELAAVLAHETAHIKQKHLSRMLIKNKQLMPMTLAGLLAGAALGTVAPEAGIHLATASLAGHSQQLINFTREHEQEADRIGIQLLAKAHYNPLGMAEVFERMKNKFSYQETPPEYLLTHPLFDSRIADAQNRAHEFPATPKTDPLVFHLIRAQLEIQKPENPAKKQARLKERLSTSNYTFLAAAEYAYALALLDNQQATEALKQLERLAQEHPEEWLIELSLAEAKAALQPIEAALVHTQALNERYPHNEAILLQHADYLLKAHQAKAVIKLLSPYRRASPQNPFTYPLLAQAYSQLKQPIGVHRAQAEWHFCRGEFKEAFAQLSFALDKTTDPSEMRHLIQQRQQIMKDIQSQQQEFS